MFVSADYSIIGKTRTIASGITFKVSEKIYYDGTEVHLSTSDISAVPSKNRAGFVSEGENISFEILENSYKVDVKKGTASVVLHGINGYGGTRTISFKISVAK